MGQCYGQLSLEERVEIYRLHAGGKSQNQIASALSRAPSTISRELRRNSRPTKVWAGGYEPVRAQQLAERRRQWNGRFKLARQPDLRNRVGKSLAMGHSPEQIAGRLGERGRARRTLRLLEKKVVELQIVDRASDSTTGRALKKTFSSPIAGSAGSSRRRPTARS
jgi:IS30 family transposase